MSAPAPGAPRRAVVKVGTGVLTSAAGGIDAGRVAGLCSQVARLRERGIEVLVVSSGAIGLGMHALRIAKRPKDTAQKQACAAIGQSLLMQTWQEGFAPHGLTVAQVLLTHADLKGRDRHLAALATLRQIAAYGAVPVINENDTVSAAEIKVGDNDTLSAMVASLVGADLLFILSTAPGLIDRRGTGKIVPVVERITPEVEAMAGGTTSETAVGGMVSKISAAKIAVRAGCGVVIASGAEPDILPRLLAGAAPGTFFAPSNRPLDAKKRWLTDFQRPTGTIRINANAVAALRDKGGSLLAVGVTAVEGAFAAGDVVDIAGPDRKAVARGTSSFSSADTMRIAGKKNDEVLALNPKVRRPEVVHRDRLVLL